MESLNTLKAQMACLIWIESLSAYLNIFFSHPFKKNIFYRNRKPITSELTRGKTTHSYSSPKSQVNFLTVMTLEKWSLLWKAEGMFCRTNMNIFFTKSDCSSFTVPSWFVREFDAWKYLMTKIAHIFSLGLILDGEWVII